MPNKAPSLGGVLCLVLWPARAALTNFALWKNKNPGIFSCISTAFWYTSGSPMFAVSEIPRASCWEEFYRRKNRKQCQWRWKGNDPMLSSASAPRLPNEPGHGAPSPCPAPLGSGSTRFPLIPILHCSLIMSYRLVSPTNVFRPRELWDTWLCLGR